MFSENFYAPDSFQNYNLFTNNFRQKIYNNEKIPPTGAWDNSPSPLRAVERNDIASLDNIQNDAEEINIYLDR